MAYTPSGTRYSYEFEYYVDDKRYNGNFSSRATIREMKLYFNDKSIPAEIDIMYNTDNHNKYDTMNIGIINGGTALNIVPDNCEISIDFRTISKNQNKKIITKINSIIKKI